MADRAVETAMSLTPHLVQMIRESGPMTVASFMQTALLHPLHGYYTTQMPFGTAGDFTTAPEISQMFGELLGLCIAQAWIDQGSPTQFTLAEAGPGRATLMADILRATQQVPGFHGALQIRLIEASPKLRAVQAETLAGYAPLWVDGFGDLPPAQLFLIANEFFDCLPPRQFIREGDGWAERVIGLDGAGALRFGKTKPAPNDMLSHRIDDTKGGDLVEVHPGASAVATQIAEHIAQNGGLGLIVDYGDWRSVGDTVQALRAHAPVDVLDGPGTADLTVHVDFEVLAEATTAAGAVHTRLTPQGVFLERLGITQRAQTLAQNLSGEALDTHVAAHRRLTAPEEMGTLFKVLGIVPATAPLPAGFAT
jgi:SAM-dependent MidA family methyltransferase